MVYTSIYKSILGNITLASDEIGITGLCIEGTLGTILSIIGGAAVVCGVALLTVSNKTK